MKTQEQLELSSKQARTAKKGVETLQDVPYLFQKGHCEHQRNGLSKLTFPILHARCASCSQIERDETHPMKKWMNFNAGVILTDEEVRQLTEKVCEISPMKW